MSLADGLFSDIFARLDSPLARLDARVKTVLCGTVLVAVAMSSHPLLPMVTLLLCVAATRFSGVPWRYIALRVAGPIGMALVLFALQSILTPGARAWEIPFGKWSLVLTDNGLRNGTLLAARVLGGMSAMLLLGAVTPAHRIFLALRWMGMPKGWVEVAMLVYRHVFVLTERAGEVLAAQQCRLGYRGLRNSLTSVGGLAGAVTLGAVDHAVRCNEAMRARGYRGEIPLGKLPPLSAREISLTAACVALIIAVVTLAEGGCSWTH